MFSTDVTIRNPIVRKESKLYSAYAGVRVVASQDVNIIDPFVRDAQFDGIYLDGSLGALTRCNVRGGWALANGRDGYRQAGFSNELADCNVDGLNAQANLGLGFTIAGTGSTITGRPVIRMAVGSNTAGAGACDRNSFTLDITGGVGATPLSGIFARPVSKWNDHTNLYLMKVATWTAL